MKLVKTLVLFVILLILIGYVYYVEIEGGKEKEKAKEFQEKLFHFENDSVRLIDIKSWRGIFQIKRVNKEEWRIIAPVETDADKNPVDRLLNTLKNMKKEREFIISENELVDFGLSGWKPITVKLTFNDGTQDSLKFGDETPVGSNVFVCKIDTVVYTVSKNNKSNAEKGLFDWRDKSVAKVKRSDIHEFILKNDHGSFLLTKEGSDWQIKKPINFRADNSTVSTILNKMEYGRAKSVIAESLKDLKEYNLDRPAYQFDLYLGEAKAHKRIRFSSVKENKAFGKDDSRPHVFTVDSIFIRDINKSLYNLRYKKIAEFNKEQAHKISITRNDSIKIIEKDTSDTWIFARRKLKNWKMNSFLNSLNNLSAKKFIAEKVISPKKYGLRNPDHKIQVYSKDGREICSVYFGDERDKNRIVAFSSNSKIIAEVDKSVLNNLEFKLDEFAEPEEQKTSQEDSD